MNHQDNIISIEEIIHAFSYVKNLKFPREELEAAIQIQDEITPVLLDYIQISPPELLSIYEDDKAVETQNMMWDFSMHLLAQFRCKEAFKPIVKFFTYPDPNMVDDAAGCFITEVLPGLLASTFNGDVERLFEVMSRDGIEPFVTASFLKSSVILYKYGELGKQDTFARYTTLLDYYIKNNEEMVTFWVSHISKLAEPQFRLDIEKTYRDKLVDLSHIKPSDIDRYYRKPTEIGDSHFSKLDDTYDLMKGWVWFTYDESASISSSLYPAPLIEYADNNVFASGQAVARDDPKTGRNEPCPCGSGKKYKKCCLH